MNRREFARSLARNGVLAAMSLAGLLGFGFKKISADESRVCPVNPSCRSCGRFVDCTEEIKQDVQQLDGAFN